LLRKFRKSSYQTDFYTYFVSLVVDIVVIGGDLVDGTVNQLTSAVDPIEWIKAKYGVYFVTGEVITHIEIFIYLLGFYVTSTL
jgi:predicted MPP superfamily phosphohydrolase